MRFLRTVESTQGYSLLDQPSAKFYFPEDFDSTLSGRIKANNSLSSSINSSGISININNQLSSVRPQLSTSSLTSASVSVTTILKKGQEQKSYSPDTTNIYLKFKFSRYSGKLSRNLTASTIGNWTFADLYEDNAPNQNIVIVQSTFRVPFVTNSSPREEFYIDFIIPIKMKNDVILKYSGIPQDCTIKKFYASCSIDVNEDSTLFLFTPDPTVTYELTYTVPLVGKSLIL